MNSEYRIKHDIPSNCVRYYHDNIGGTMIKLILTCLLIPVIVYVVITVVVLASPILVAGLIYTTLKYRREMV